MKNLYQQKRQSGFTIIEVLIVLAIAALILLIVFLAVPALQRNSRNNSTRQEAAAVLASANDFVANNNGQLPTTVSADNGTVTVEGAVGTTSSETKVRGGTVVNSNTTGDAPDTTALGTITIAIGYKCEGNDSQEAPRAFAALFNVETNGSGTGSPQCLES